MGGLASLLPQPNSDNWYFENQKAKAAIEQAKASTLATRAGIPYTQALTDEVNAKNEILKRQEGSAAGFAKYFQKMGQTDLGQRAAPTVATPDAVPVVPVDSAAAPASTPVPGALPAPIAPIASAAPAASTVPSSAPTPLVRPTSGLPAPIAPTVATPIADPLQRMYQDLIDSGVHPKDAGPYVTTLIEQNKSLAGNTAANMKIAQDNHEAVSEAYYNWVQAGATPQGYQVFKQNAKAREPGLQLPDEAPQDEGGRNFIAGQLAVAGKFLGAKKEQTTIDKDAAEAAAKNAETPGIKAKSEEEQRKNELQKAAIAEFHKDPRSGGDVIDAALPSSLDPVANASIKAGWKAAMGRGDLEAAAGFVKQATEHAGQIGMQTSPAVIAGKAKTAGEEAKARAPIERGNAMTLASFNNNLEQQRTVRAKSQDALADYGQSVATAKTLQNAIDLSRGGNQVSGQALKSLVPAYQLAMFDIKRLAGMRGNEGLGSLQDNLQNGYTSLVSNKPLNDQEIKAIEPWVKVIANGAAGRYNAVADSLNESYKGTRTEHVKNPFPDQAAPAASSDMIKVQIPGRQPGSIHASQKDRFLKDHPKAKVLE